MGVSVINLLVSTCLGSLCCGQQAVNFSHLVGVLKSAKQPKDTVAVYPLGGASTPPLGCTLVS